MTEDRYTQIVSMKRWFTIQEGADYLSLSRWTIMGLIKTGKIPASRVGRSVRLDVQDLDRFMEGHKTMNGHLDTEQAAHD